MRELVHASWLYLLAPLRDGARGRAVGAQTGLGP
jgi:hypothetical protein